MLLNAIVISSDYVNEDFIANELSLNWNGLRNEDEMAD